MIRRTERRPRRSSLLVTALVAALMAAAPLAPPATAAAGSSADTLLSGGKPVTASSVEGSGFEAAKAVDGNASTRWASVEGHDPEWIRVDLGDTYNVSRVKLSWEAAYGKSYKIQTSPDGATWTDVYS
ncbi:discoidin domain-containing protein, partial [Nonomuraea sp. NPDC001684]